MPSEKPYHLGQRADKNARHFRALKVAPSKDECSDSRSHNRRDSRFTVANFLIFSEDDPTSLACLAEPLLIRSIRGEVIIVDLDDCTSLPERGRDDSAPERSVKKKDR